MTASSAVAWIAAALVCNLLAMRLIFEFMQLWYLGLALPAALFGPSFALVYGGSWMGGKFADRLRRPAVILTAGLLVLAASAGLMFRVAPVAVGAQVVAIAGIIALQVVLSGYLHDAMPSGIRAGASSMVSTASMLAFLPVALGFGVVARDYSIFRASWLVIGAIAGMTVALAVVVARNLESRYVLRLMAAVAAGLIVAAGAVAGYELMRGPAASIKAGTTAAPPARAAIDPVPLDPGLPRPFRPSRPPVTSAPVLPAQPIVPASPAIASALTAGPARTVTDRTTAISGPAITTTARLTLAVTHITRAHSTLVITGLAITHTHITIAHTDSDLAVADADLSVAVANLAVTVADLAVANVQLSVAVAVAGLTVARLADAHRPVALVAVFGGMAVSARRVGLGTSERMVARRVVLTPPTHRTPCAGSWRPGACCA